MDGSFYMFNRYGSFCRYMKQCLVQYNYLYNNNYSRKNSVLHTQYVKLYSNDSTVIT